MPGCGVGVDAHRVAHHRDEVLVGQRAVPERSPVVAAVGGAPHAGVTVDRPAGTGVDDREGEDGLGVVGVDHDREAELRGESGRDVLPGVAPVVGAVDTAVVLQVQPVGARRVAGHLVHALAELGVAPVARHELRLHAGVGRVPGVPAVVGAVDAAGRDGGEHLLRLLRVGQDRVERLAPVAGVPLLALRVLPQAALELEGLTAVGGLEDRAGLGAGVHHAVLDARGQLPDAGDGLAGVLGEADGAVRSLLPGLAEVVRAPHLRAEPAGAGAGEKARAPAAGVDQGGVDLLHREVGAGPRPVPASLVGAPDPQTLAGPHHQQRVDHDHPSRDYSC